MRMQTALSDARPDMASLRIIRDSELRLGEVIGSGAFGTVYSVKLKGNFITLLCCGWGDGKCKTC